MADVSESVIRGVILKDFIITGAATGKDYCPMQNPLDNGMNVST